MKHYRLDDINTASAALYLFEATVTDPENTHSHDFFEIVYVRDGSASESVDDATYEVRRGDLILINCSSTHRFVPHGSFSYVNVCVRPDRLLADPVYEPYALALLQLTAMDELRQNTDLGRVRIPAPRRTELEHLLSAMLTEYSSPSPYRDAILSGYLHVLICLILEATETMRLSDRDQDVLRDLLFYIDGHPDADLTLTALAKQCFYNPSYLSRAFKERFGLTLTDYVSDRKLAYADALQREGGRTLTEIAHLAGFSSASALRRTSIRRRGLPFAASGKKTDEKTAKR